MEDATPKPQRSLPIRDSRSRSPRSRTPPSDDEDMNARTPVARNGRRANDEKDASERERELAEQLRQRAMASKNGSRSERQPRSLTRSPPSRATSRSRSPSRSRSRETHRSHRSHRSHVSRRTGHEKSRGSERDRDYERDEERRRRRRERERGADHEDEERPRRRAAYDDEDRERERRKRRERDPEEEDRYRSRRHGSRYDRDRYDPYYETRDRYDPYYDPYARSRRRDDPYYDDRRASRVRDLKSASPSRSVRSASRAHSPPARVPDPEDYEERSVFCSQLAARLGQRDLGEFFEEQLGEGAVQDVRIVTDRISRRSKGIGYVEFASSELVPKAMALSGQVLFGIPILIQKTDAARNRGEASPSDAPYRPNLPQTAQSSSLNPAILPSIPLPPHFQPSGAPIHLNLGTVGGESAARGPVVHPNTAARLYVGSLHFNLTDADVKQVFEPFGEVEYVDLHREPGTGKSKGFAFVQFVQPDDAKKALEQMNGFELAGRPIRVGNVNARGTGSNSVQSPMTGDSSGAGATTTSSFDEGGGGGLNPMTRASLMEKLARTDSSSAALSVPQEQLRPNIPQATTNSVLLKNMFNPEEETERDWDTDLAEDVKGECQDKYGPVTSIHVERESAGEIYVKFADVASATKAIDGLNGRWFGGKLISAHYISEAIMNAKLG